MNEIIFLVENTIDDGYTARTLGAPIFTEGENLDEFRINVSDTVDCHYEANQKPKITRLYFVSEESNVGMKLPRDISRTIV